MYLLTSIYRFLFLFWHDSSCVQLPRWHFVTEWELLRHPLSHFNLHVDPPLRPRPLDTVAPLQLMRPWDGGNGGLHHERTLQEGKWPFHFKSSRHVRLLAPVGSVVGSRHVKLHVLFWFLSQFIFKYFGTWQNWVTTWICTLQALNIWFWYTIWPIIMYTPLSIKVPSLGPYLVTNLKSRGAFLPEHVCKRGGCNITLLTPTLAINVLSRGHLMQLMSWGISFIVLVFIRIGFAELSLPPPVLTTARPK